MILRTTCLVVLCLLAPSGVSAQFEGLVQSTNTTVDELGVAQKYTMTIWLKGSWARVTTSGTASLPGSTLIVRPDLQVRWVLDDSSRTYYEVQETVGAPTAPDDAKRAPSSALRKTGKTRKILGYLCDEYRVTHDEVTTELWGTKGLAAIQSAMRSAFGAGEESDESWASDLAALGITPMIATTKIDGVVMESHEVVKIEQHSLSAELFSLPEGYHKHSLNDTLK
jgi:hypothetical protein